MASATQKLEFGIYFVRVLSNLNRHVSVATVETAQLWAGVSAFSEKGWVVPVYLGDVAGSVPHLCRKAHVTVNQVLRSAYKSHAYTLALVR